MYFTLILVKFLSKIDDHENELTAAVSHRKERNQSAAVSHRKERNQSAAVSHRKERKQPTIQDVKQKENPGAENRCR